MVQPQEDQDKVVKERERCRRKGGEEDQSFFAPTMIQRVWCGTYCTYSHTNLVGPAQEGGTKTGCGTRGIRGERTEV